MIAGRNWSDNIETYIVYLVVLISLDLQGKRSFEAGIEREVRLVMLIIGFTGSFGSGCTHIAKRYIEPNGYKYISLSDILRQEYKSKNGSTSEPNRQMLQDFGNQVRKENGPDFLARKAIELIKNEPDQEKWVIDSIRNPHEVKYFRLNFIYLVSSLIMIPVGNG